MDLTLVEKITQVLQSTQIKIKSEVHRSGPCINGARTHQFGSVVSTMCPFCVSVCLSVHPLQVAASNTQYQMIKERVVQLPHQIASSADETQAVCVALKEVFQMVGKRVEYLHCSVHHQGARVGVVEENLVTPLSSITATQAILE